MGILKVNVDVSIFSGGCSMAVVVRDSGASICHLETSRACIEVVDVAKLLAVLFIMQFCWLLGGCMLWTVMPFQWCKF